MNRTFVLVLAAGFFSCPKEKEAAAKIVQPVSAERPSAQTPRVEQLRAAEAQAIALEDAPCSKPVAVYDGSVTVASTEFVHLVERSGEWVDAPIDGLDRVIDPRRNVPFTLTYPFEKPWIGTVDGPLTRRKVITAIRRGFREMYEGAKVDDIPGMMNKDVAGKYGQSFHAIEDLVIERVVLCAEGHLDVSIGS